jgi:hypothetical protein
MNARPSLLARLFGAVATAGLLALAVAANAATITIVNTNAAGVGFNDATAAAPVPGNPGTTVGAQRLYVFNYAASIWGSLINSPVPIQVNASFATQTCTATSATLGSTSSSSSHRDFAGAPFPGTWYQQSLANRLYGADLNTGANDMTTTFNSALNGAATCLGGVGWYYGTDGNEGTNIELLSVVLHELAHGFGFASTTNSSTGAMSSGYPAAYDRFLYDDSLAAYWPTLTNAQRKLSATSQKNLTWSGGYVAPAAAGFLAKRQRMVINSPPSIAAVTYSIGPAVFGPSLYAGSVTGDVVLVSDITAPTSDGCETFTNGPALAGKIALVDRGVCAFVAKAESCQAYGAIAVVIANNTTGIILPGGTDPAITIPVISILQSDGNAIKTALGTGPVNLTLGIDPVLMAGADNAGRPLMYTPATYASGSTVSHWDVSLTPNALMEPNINQDLHSSVDLTRNLLWDIGWWDAPVATLLNRFTAEDVNGGILLTWQFSDPSGIGAITVERSTTVEGPWSPISVIASTDGEFSKALDENVDASTSYYYRLSVMDRVGSTTTYGLAAGRHAATIDGPVALFAPSPNPVRSASSLAFRLSQPEFVRMSIVDASGRQVRTLANSMMLPGEHIQMWDGHGDSGQRVAPGLYFVTLRTSKSLLSQRLAVIH